MTCSTSWATAIPATLACVHIFQDTQREHFVEENTLIWQKICSAYHRLRHWLRHGHGRLCRWRSDCRCSSALSTGNQRLDCCLTMEHFLYKEWGEHKKNTACFGFKMQDRINIYWVENNCLLTVTHLFILTKAISGSTIRMTTWACSRA